MQQQDNYYDNSYQMHGVFEDPFAAAQGTAVEDEGKGLSCEIKTYERRYNSHGDRKLLQVGKSTRWRDDTDRDFESALVLVKSYDKDMNLEQTELHVQSPHVKKALRDVLHEYPGMNLGASKITIRDVPMCFFHYRKEFAEYGSHMSDPVAVQHLVFVLRYMYQALESQTLNYINWMESPKVVPGLLYENLWMAFRPGDLVYSKINGHHRILRFQAMDERKSAFVNDPNPKIWTVQVSQMVYNGSSFGYTDRHFEIKPYDNYKPLAELNIFPLEFHPDRKTIYDALVTRGEKYVSLRGIHYKTYKGRAAVLSPFRRDTAHGEMDDHPIRAMSIKGRVMIDVNTFNDANPMHAVYLSSKRKQFRCDNEENLGLSQVELAMCRPFIAGFSLKEKAWAFFSVDHISEINFDIEAFDELILPKGQKEMIYSLVNSHAEHRAEFDDFISGKGRGMVFLLHGAAGVGKTITAESVSERTKQPLYVVGCGDLGVDVNSVEEKLATIFQRATAWNAIILLDEVDVFLQQRTAHDLERNALVSVFLRVLEYYEGVIFLTTNRVNQFDKAFKSRIHMAINYPQLSFASRRELWKTFIARGCKGSAPDWLTEHQLDHFAEEGLNGRQIKNTVRTAHALAMSSSSHLKHAHVLSSLQYMKSFDDVVLGDSEELRKHPGA